MAMTSEGVARAYPSHAEQTAFPYPMLLKCFRSKFTAGWKVAAARRFQRRDTAPVEGYEEQKESLHASHNQKREKSTSNV